MGTSQCICFMCGIILHISQLLLPLYEPVNVCCMEEVIEMPNVIYNTITVCIHYCNWSLSEYSQCKEGLGSPELNGISCSGYHMESMATSVTGLPLYDHSSASYTNLFFFFLELSDCCNNGAFILQNVKIAYSEDFIMP